MSEEYTKCPPTAKLISMVHSLRQELEVTRRALEEATGGVCKWVDNGLGTRTGNTSCGFVGAMQPEWYEAKFCPYCGKRIEGKDG